MACVNSDCTCSVHMAYGPLHATPITLGVAMGGHEVSLENWLLHQVALLCSYHILVTQRTKNKSSVVGWTHLSANSELQIRENKDNLTIIFLIFPLKHLL